jgi:hypothetical protein
MTEVVDSEMAAASVFDDPIFDWLRDDPEFAELHERIRNQQ